MAAKFFALLTNQGAAKLSNMAAMGEKLEITSLAVGDGGGVSPTPNQAQTKLVNEVRRAQLNSLSVDVKNDSQIIAEQIIPESVGGWWIREIGLFDADGVLIAVANCPETYKATTEEGSGRTQVIRMMLTVSSTDAVTLKVDPSIVLATRQYVDSAVIEVKTYTDNVMKKHVAADNPHSQYLLIKNALKELADDGLVGEALANLGLDHFGYEPTTGETAIFNGNKNLRYFINNNNESGVASIEFGLLWGFDGGGKLTKGIIPVARLDGLSQETGNSKTEVMSQKAVTEAIPTITQSTGASTTSVMSQKATTEAINGVKTTVVQSVGTSTTSVMSQNAVTSLVNDAASLGVNQLWNDVTSSRTVGINYTNTTGRPIMIAMNVKNVPSGLFASSIFVQGIELSAGSTVSGEHRFISAIVPPGQVYRFQPLASSNFTLLELR